MYTRRITKILLKEDFMWEDPIVEEVREARAKIAKKCGYSFKKLSKMLKAGENRSRKLGWKIVSLKRKNQKVKI